MFNVIFNVLQTYFLPYFDFDLRTDFQKKHIFYIYLKN